MSCCTIMLFTILQRGTRSEKGSEQCASVSAVLAACNMFGLNTINIENRNKVHHNDPPQPHPRANKK